MKAIGIEISQSPEPNLDEGDLSETGWCVGGFRLFIVGVYGTQDMTSVRNPWIFLVFRQRSA